MLFKIITDVLFVGILLFIACYAIYMALMNFSEVLFECRKARNKSNPIGGMKNES